MKKKSAIALVSVAAIFVLGLVLSLVIDWPVDTGKASGNIAKSSRFSRKTAVEALSNMQELLENDADFKNSVMLSYMVMNARANAFSALVEMSEQATAGIPEFESVIRNMKAVMPMVKNVCAAMEAAGKDIDTALGGEKAKDLPQNTNNAALAYNTLQKQNAMADRFIATADSYLAGRDMDSQIAFVRDQWLEYQTMTAALNQDKDALAQLEQKGHLQSAEQSIVSLASFPNTCQNAIVQQAAMGNVMSFADRTMAQNLVIQQSLHQNNTERTFSQNEMRLNNMERSLNQNVQEIYYEMGRVASYKTLCESLSGRENMQAYIIPLANTVVVSMNEKVSSFNQNVASLKQNDVALNESLRTLNDNAAVFNQNVARLNQNVGNFLPTETAVVFKESATALNQIATALHENVDLISQNGNRSLNQNITTISQNAATVSQHIVSMSNRTMNDLVKVTGNWELMEDHITAGFNAMEKGEIRITN